MVYFSLSVIFLAGGVCGYDICQNDTSGGLFIVGLLIAISTAIPLSHD